MKSILSHILGKNNPYEQTHPHRCHPGTAAHLTAGLFMSALVVRSLPPLLSEPAFSAQRIVMWYAGRNWTLWVLLLAMPLTRLLTGCAGLLGNWMGAPGPQQAAHHPFALLHRSPLELFVAMQTLLAGVFLAVAVVHMLMN